MDHARLFCFGFEGTQPPDSLLFTLDRRHVGAVILFARNIADPNQIRSMCQRLREAGGEDLWILIDQEGGPVRRIKDPDIGPPPPDDLATRSPDEVEQAHRDTALKLRELGIDFNLAPVADVKVNPRCKVLEGRTFGSETDSVAPRVAAAVRGIQSAGLKACAKHFPGLGEVDTDPHTAATLDPRTIPYYRRVHFPAFRAAIDADVAGVMSTHLLAVQFDPHRIATYSPIIVREYLEAELGFAGLILTDDLEMKGLPDPPPVAAWQAFTAGHNLLLMCHSERAQQDALDLFASKLAGDQEAQRLLHRALDRQQPKRTPFAYAAQ